MVKFGNLQCGARFHSDGVNFFKLMERKSVTQNGDTRLKNAIHVPEKGEKQYRWFDEATLVHKGHLDHKTQRPKPKVVQLFGLKEA